MTKLFGHKPETFLADNQHLALRRELVLDCPGEVRVELGEGQTEEEPREVVVQLALHDRPLITKSKLNRAHRVATQFKVLQEKHNISCKKFLQKKKRKKCRSAWAIDVDVEMVARAVVVCVPMSLSWFSMKRGTWVEDLMCALSRCVLSLMSSTV